MAEAALSGQDLRSAAIDSKRYHDNKHKWARIHNRNPWRPIVRRGPSTSPNQPLRDEVIQAVSETHMELASLPDLSRQVFYDDSQHTSDSSADELDNEHPPGPEPDAGITYSFDHASGPGNGSHILGEALVRAIERFEDVQTERLVSTEYQLLDESGELLNSKEITKAKQRPPSDEDDYEFI